MLIDLDGQSSLTSYFTNDIETIKSKNIYKVIKGEQKIDEAICVHNNNLHFIPSIIDFTGVTTEFLQSDRSYKLRDAMDGWDCQYDIIITDAPPTILLENTLAISIADVCIVPVMLDEFNLMALDKQLNAMKIDQMHVNRLMEIKIVINNFEENRKLNDKIIDELKVIYPDKLLKSIIHRSAELQKQVAKESDKKFNSGLRIYQEIELLCKEVLEHGKRINANRT